MYPLAVCICIFPTARLRRYAGVEGWSGPAVVRKDCDMWQCRGLYYTRVQYTAPHWVNFWLFSDVNLFGLSSGRRSCRTNEFSLKIFAMFVMVLSLLKVTETAVRCVVAERHFTVPRSQQSHRWLRLVLLHTAEFCTSAMLCSVCRNLTTVDITWCCCPENSMWLICMPESFEKVPNQRLL